MSTKESSIPAEPALGASWGALIGAAMAAGTQQRRLASAALLEEKLRRAGVALVTAELGRTPNGPAWVLTVEAPDQRISTVNAPLAAEQDPHAARTADEVVARVLRYLERIG